MTGAKHAAKKSRARAANTKRHTTARPRRSIGVEELEPAPLLPREVAPRPRNPYGEDLTRWARWIGGAAVGLVVGFVAAHFVL